MSSIRPRTLRTSSAICLRSLGQLAMGRRILRNALLLVLPVLLGGRDRSIDLAFRPALLGPLGEREGRASAAQPPAAACGELLAEQRRLVRRAERTEDYVGPYVNARAPSGAAVRSAAGPGVTPHSEVARRS